MEKRKVVRKIAYVTVIALVVVGGVLVIASTLGIFGIRALVVVSGSMEPSVPAKSIVLLMPKKFYGLNDIITFKHSGREDVLVTHRIVSYRKIDDELVYKTKGDANEDPDEETVNTSSIVGSVFLTIPYIGSVITFAQTVPGFIFLIIVPACIIVYHELYSLKIALAKILFQKPNKPKRTAGRRVVKNV